MSDPGIGGSQYTAIREQMAITRTSWWGTPTEARPATRIASGAPRPPGTGTMFDAAPANWVMTTRAATLVHWLEKAWTNRARQAVSPVIVMSSPAPIHSVRRGWPIRTRMYETDPRAQMAARCRSRGTLMATVTATATTMTPRTISHRLQIR